MSLSEPIQKEIEEYIQSCVYMKYVFSDGCISPHHLDEVELVMCNEGISPKYVKDFLAYYEVSVYDIGDEIEEILVGVPVTDDDVSYLNFLVNRYHRCMVSELTVISGALTIAKNFYDK